MVHNIQDGVEIEEVDAEWYQKQFKAMSLPMSDLRDFDYYDDIPLATQK